MPDASPGVSQPPQSDFEPEAQSFRAGLFSSPRWRSIFRGALDLLFPPRCAGCGRVDTYWCAYCARDTERIPILGAVATVAPLTASAATAWHEGKLQAAVQAFKYERAVDLAALLAERLIRCLKAQQWSVQMIVPVPLHSTRLRARGYNQANLLGALVAQRLAIPFHPSALSRTRNTRSQVGLGRAERQANVAGAFAATGVVSGQIILLIDDVFTTGATLAACAQALLDAGAVQVYSLTVTKALTASVSASL